MELKENLKTIFDELENFLTTKTVVGEPIEVKDATLIPVINISFGMGTGVGGGENSKKDNREGGGAGLGAKISPTAIVVIRDGNISAIPINRTGGVEKLVDMVPELLKKFKGRDKGAKSGGSEKGKDKQQVPIR